MDSRTGIGAAERVGVALIFLVALSLRVLHVLALERNDPFFDAPAVDAQMYHEWAQRIAGGEWKSDQVFLNGPGYPYTLAVLYAVFGPSLLAAKMFQAVLGATDCVLVWWLGRRLFDARVGLAAAVAVAAYRMLIFYEGTLVVANLQISLTLVGLIAVVAALERPRVAIWAAAGALMGISALARPTALIFVAGISAGLLLGVRPGLAWSRRALLTFVFVLGTGLTLLPATLHNAVVGGDFVLVTSSGGMNLFVGNNPSANGVFQVPRIFPQFLADDPWEQRAVYHQMAERAEKRKLRPSEVSSFWRDASVRWIRQHPGAWARLMWRKLRLSVNAFEPWNIRTVTLVREFSWVLALPLLGFGVLAPVAFTGVLWSARDWRRLFPVHVALATIWLVLLAFFMLSRYRLPAVPLLAIFAAFAGFHAIDAARERRFRRLLAMAVCTGITAVGVNSTVTREDLTVAYYNLANRYKAQENWEPAIEAYGEAIRRNPRYLSAHNNRALVYEATGEHREEAIAAWRYILAVGQQRKLDRYTERAERHLTALGAEFEDPPEPGPAE
jgi:4-amino-4-deoxy-L-arabinose transferase-like glycosyltransferase